MRLKVKNKFVGGYTVAYTIQTLTRLGLEKFNKTLRLVS